MRTLEAARDELLAGLTPGATEWVPLARASGRILATPGIAQVDLPGFDNSLLDGFAVRAEDLFAAPIRLQIRGRTPAGKGPGSPLGPQEARRIFTGAPLPAGSDAVVAQEDTRSVPGDPDAVEILERVRPWDHVRFRGEDVRRGTVLLEAGIRLHPGSIGLLAASGHSRVEVYRQPRVALLVTGDELVPPGEPLGEGQIFESNSLMLTSLMATVGAEVTSGARLVDDAVVTRNALLSAAREADLLVTVGGASVGDHDFVRPAVESAGGSVDLWQLALKPGKPFFHGRLLGRPLLGLPGNPVSAFVTAVLLVLPALRRLQGQNTSSCPPPTTPGILREELQNSGPRRHFVRVRTGPDGGVHSAGAQASHRLASLAAADGLVDVPPDSTLPAGTAIAVHRW